MDLRLNKLAFALLACALLGRAAIAADAHVIVNNEVSTSQINKEMIRAIFIMRLRHWPDNSSIRVFVLPDRNPTHRRFSKKYLGVFPHQLRRRWDRQVFSGTGQAPTEVADQADMLQQVKSTKGAIGYLSNAAEDKGVQTLSID
jgi:ABC-type phosphate transport system substrate-binding protein